MSSIEAKITLDLEDGQDASRLIETIRSILSSINGRDTQVNVVDVDGPTNPFATRTGIE